MTRHTLNRVARRSTTGGDVAVGAAVIAGVLALVAALYAIAALIFMFAWNVGVDAIVTAAGGNVGDIGFLPALGGVFVIGILRSLLGRNSTVESKA